MRVGLVYDPLYLEHDTVSHVENSGRLVETMGLLERSGLRGQLTSIPPRATSIEELETVHSPQHISYIEAFALQGGGWLTPDTVMSPASFRVALYAAGGLIEAVAAVMAGQVNSAFALVRPPGHHATRWQAMGFCLFNNVAVAANYALTAYGLDRILIADFDVHHGNGTQEAFYDDPRVLYFSVHEYPFYPGTGAIDEVGNGAGRGTTVNVPLPAGCGDAEYTRAFQEVLVPAVTHFRPQLILVSAGYDTHWADQMSLMQVSISGFTKMVGTLKQLASELSQGRIVFTLEGGYHLQALAYSIKATLDVLLGNPEGGEPLGPAPAGRRSPPIDAIIAAVRERHGLA